MDLNPIYDIYIYTLFTNHKYKFHQVHSFRSTSNNDLFEVTVDNQQYEQIQYINTVVWVFLKNCPENAHHMNHPWWSSYLDFKLNVLKVKGMARLPVTLLWYEIIARGCLSETTMTITSYDLTKTTIHYNIACTNMCFFSYARHNPVEILCIGHPESSKT